MKNKRLSPTKINRLQNGIDQLFIKTDILFSLISEYEAINNHASSLLRQSLEKSINNISKNLPLEN